MDVLIVDDNADFARSARNLVAERTGLATSWTTDPGTAQRMVEQENLAVVVLDQKMPSMTGTELFRRLRTGREDFRAIMLTGEATAAEVGLAIPLGYGDFLAKSRIRELPEKVYLQYIQALTERARLRHEGGTVIWQPGRPARYWRQVRLRLISVAVLDDRFVEDSRWRTVTQLQAGEERKFLYQATQKHSLVVDEENKKLLQGCLKVGPASIGQVLTSLAEASTSTRTTRTGELAQNEQFERSIGLPAAERTPGGQPIRSRHFQQAPILRKVLLHLQVERQCCGMRDTLRILALEDTGGIATRHQDYLDDGTVVQVETGDLR